MQKRKLQALIVRSTDDYLNEYVPREKNLRYLLSNFSGSTGDMIITHTKVFLFVDGRYHVQANQETDADLIYVVKVPFGISNESSLREKLVELANIRKSTYHIGFNGNRVSFHDVRLIKRELKETKFRLIDVGANFIKALNIEPEEQDSITIEKIPISIAGLSVDQKKEAVQSWLKENDLDYILLTQLEDISYLLNLRSYHIPYNSTISGSALLSQTNGYIFLADNVPDRIKEECNDLFRCYSEKDFSGIVSKLFKKTSRKHPEIAFDEYVTSYSRIKMIRKSIGDDHSLRRIESPLAEMRRIKTPEELEYMAQSFRRADVVIKQVIEWANSQVNSGKAISEKDVSEKVKSLFYSHGAKGLSFEVISAVGENGAIVHYTKADSTKILKKGDLMLLDTGAYFEGGYATDLTRTFLVGGSEAEANDKQKEIYSVTLKGAIRLMKAKFPKGSKGFHLDVIARSAMWGHHYIYGHGTGHGIGISVHETPPRLNDQSKDEIKANMVFSVEPGIYLEGFGGVRIENIVTVEQDRDNKNFLKIKPLTFCPLDVNLIDESYLDDSEREWLKWYMEKSAELVD